MLILHNGATDTPTKEVLLSAKCVPFLLDEAYKHTADVMSFMALKQELGLSVVARYAQKRCYLVVKDKDGRVIVNMWKSIRIPNSQSLSTIERKAKLNTCSQVTYMSLVSQAVPKLLAYKAKNMFELFHSKLAVKGKARQLLKI